MFANYFVLITLPAYLDRFLTVKTQTSAAYLKKLLCSLIMLNKLAGEFWFIALKGEVEVLR